MTSCTSSAARCDALSFFMVIMEPGRACERARVRYLLTLRLRYRGRGVTGNRRRWRLRGLRRLLAARDRFEPFDFFDVRQEHRFGRILRELRTDRIGLR